MRKKSCLLCLFSLTILLAGIVSQAQAAVPRETSDQEKQIEAMVKSAVKLIETEGEAAFSKLNVKDGPWHKGDTGVFVSDDKGVELVNPAQPSVVGKSMADYKDPDGKMVFQEQWNMIQGGGQGWMECKWNNPTTGKPTSCRAFVMGAKFGGKLYLVGAAYYIK